MKVQELVSSWRERASGMNINDPRKTLLNDCADDLEVADEYVWDNDPQCGQEAEELRAGIEEIQRDPPLSSDEFSGILQKLLDSVDARDSLHFLAAKQNRETQQENP